MASVGWNAQLGSHRLGHSVIVIETRQSTTGGSHDDREHITLNHVGLEGHFQNPAKFRSCSSSEDMSAASVTNRAIIDQGGNTAPRDARHLKLQHS